MRWDCKAKNPMNFGFTMFMGNININTEQREREREREVAKKYLDPKKVLLPLPLNIILLCF